MKLIDKGVGKEALAFLVLFQFPVELASAILAGRCVGMRWSCPSGIISICNSCHVTLNL